MRQLPVDAGLLAGREGARADAETRRYEGRGRRGRVRCIAPLHLGSVDRRRSMQRAEGRRGALVISAPCEVRRAAAWHAPSAWTCNSCASSRAYSERSSVDVVPSTSSGSSVSNGPLSAGSGTFWSTNMTWKIGFALDRAPDAVPPSCVRNASNTCSSIAKRSKRTRSSGPCARSNGCPVSWRVRRSTWASLR